MGGGIINTVVDLELFEERVASLVKSIAFVWTVGRSVGGGRKFAVELVEFGRFFERKLEVRREMVVLGLTGVDVGGWLVEEMTINKVSGVPKVSVFWGILTWVDNVVDVTKIGIL